MPQRHVIEAARIVFLVAWATLVVGGIAASRYAAVRQRRGAVISSTSTSIGELLRSRVTARWITVIVAEFVLAGLLYLLARLTG
jgi:hypothetical protein